MKQRISNIDTFINENLNNDIEKLLQTIII